MKVIDVDIVVGLQYGDEAKGKITHHLLSKDHYDFVCRASGGPNAGHTIYHKNKKIITHHIPTGVFYGMPSVIGSGCVISPVTLTEEMDEIEDIVILYTSLDDFGNMQNHLESLNIEVANAELQRIPNNTTALDVDNSKKVLRLIDKMEEDEDVNCVYHNLEMTDDLVKVLEAED